jgi:uncharacterized surface protein with fasciclin (FAS1) repeats
MKTTTSAAVLAALALVACNPSPDAEATGPAEPTSRTLAAELRDDGALGTLEGVMTNSGLEQVLEGVGPYTVLAPADGAFGANEAFDFRDDAEKAQAAALIRAHMLPGSVTRADVEAAVAKAEDGKVEMRTLDGALLTFSKEGEGLVVSTADGAKATLTGSETVASNGVIQPIDGVLMPAPSGG